MTWSVLSASVGTAASLAPRFGARPHTAARLQPRSSTVARASEEASENMTVQQDIKKLQEQLKAIKAQREAMANAQLEELRAEHKRSTRALGVMFLLLCFTFQILRRAYAEPTHAHVYAERPCAHCGCVPVSREHDAYRKG